MPQILVAEDNDLLARVIRVNLEKAGFDVTIAVDGRQAWEFAQQDYFDAVITDYSMPRMTGTDLCRRLRRDPRYAEIPILLLTANYDELEVDGLMQEIRVSEVWGKPFSPGRLTRRLGEMIAGTHRQTPD